MVCLPYRLFIPFYEMNLSPIRSDRQIKASIGFSISDWKKLSVLFEEHHQGISGAFQKNIRNCYLTPFRMIVVKFFNNSICSLSVV
jgi:hypothetical protein